MDRWDVAEICVSVVMALMAILIMATPGCTPQARLKMAQSLRPACEAVLLDSPDVADLAGRIEITPEEYAKAVCAMPGVALSLAAKREPVKP
jgi:hypothetical protein